MKWKKVLMGLTMQIIVSYDVLLCSLAASYQCFEEPVASIFRIIQGGSTFLRNTANELQTTQHHIPESSN